VTPGATNLLADLVGWVERAEALGVDGVFVGDRLLAEARSQQQAVYSASMVDVTVALSTIAARTSRVLLGPLVLVLPYRHPVQLAKMVASLDVASRGRLVLGVGSGWNSREFEVLGLPISERAARFEEILEILRLLLSGQPVDFEGEFWQLSNVQITPVSTRGVPPIWMASFSPSQSLNWPTEPPPRSLPQLARVGRLADGWVPLIYSASSYRRLDAQVLGRAWQRVLEAADAAGRSREDIDFVFSDWCYVLDGPESRIGCERALGAFFSGDWVDACRTYNIGPEVEVLDRIRQHTAAIDRVDGYILTPLSDELAQLDAMASLAASLRGS
jgi:probable F420-dependent oxidoreductase